jgi:DNA-binding CsgD family transcriptional regulator
MNKLDEFSQLTLDLYRSVSCVKPDGFRGWAFDRLQQFIEFDSAIWIQATLVEDIPVTQNVYLHNQPDVMLEEYAKWNSDDVILEAIMCNPGRCFLWRDLEDFEMRYKTEMYREYESKYGLEDCVSIMIPFGGSGIQTFLSLYRSQRERPFTINDGECFQAIAPHLVEAESTLLTRHIRHTHGIGQADHSVAMIGKEGHLKMAEMGFIGCLNTGWPDWNPPQIPIEILSSVNHMKETGEVVNGYFVQARQAADGVVLSIRLMRPLDLLTLREQQVATMVADGMPYKVVAKELDISPSTVTNHINSVHSKLEVTSRAELRKALRDS